MANKEKQAKETAEDNEYNADDPIIATHWFPKAAVRGSETQLANLSRYTDADGHKYQVRASLYNASVGPLVAVPVTAKELALLYDFPLSRK